MILYQLLLGLALPFVLLAEALRGPKGALRDRLGLAPLPARRLGGGRRLWLHAASVGEANSARWVMEALIAARPGLQILVTCNSATGRQQVQSWNLPGVTAALAPFDSAGAAARLLDRLEPQALVVVENELWPARLAAAERRGVPVLVIGARLSARSARRWQRLAPGLMARTLGCISWLSAQDAGSLERLRALGLPQAAVGPVVALKAMAQANPAPPPFAAPAPRHRILLAASTHEGEEGLILNAFQAARVQFDHLIIAPRHPRRSAEVQALLAGAGLRFACRSAGGRPEPGDAVYLADSLGEMDHWYAMAGACVIGGTFAPRGGHTPWEPARHGMALMHGPSVSNFAAPFAALDRAGGAIAARDGADLAQALAALTPARQTEMATAAAAVLAPSDDGQAVVAALVQAIRG